MKRVVWPNGKAFAFTIVDDTDNATVENTAPVYRLLKHYGVFITKTVWPLPSDPDDRYWAESLEDPRYRDYILQLRSEGFEIGYHGTRAGRSERSQIHEGLDVFREVLGEDPRTYAQHASSRENLYWGAKRIDLAPLKPIVAKRHQHPRFYGDEEASPYFWGDLCRERIRYVRNYGFAGANLFTSDPYTPFHDPRRPYVNYWFSSSGLSIKPQTLAKHLDDARFGQWEQQGALVILGAHLGQGFCEGERVRPAFAAGIQKLSERNGWFAPVGEILDYLRTTVGPAEVTPSQRLRLQARWTRDLGWKVVRDNLRRRFGPAQEASPDWERIERAEPNAAPRSHVEGTKAA